MTPTILIPCYRPIAPLVAGAPEAPVSDLLRELSVRGYGALFVARCAAIDLARNVLASRALECAAEWHLWLDCDISMSADDAVRLVRSAQHHSADIMAAEYLTHSGGSTTCSNHGGTGVQPMQRCGFGATVTRRYTLERISESLPLTQFCEGFCGYPFFLPMIYRQQYLSEDYAFCQRAIEAGLQLRVNYDVRPQHDR